MKVKFKVKFRVIKSNTAPEHRRTKKFRWLGQRFSCVGHALATMINVVGQLRCDWDRIDIQLIRRKEEKDGKEKAVQSAAVDGVSVNHADGLSATF